MRFIKPALGIVAAVAMFTVFRSVFAKAQPVQGNLYQFKLTTLEGQPFDFQQLKGKKVLIVNTASKCGYTPQYAELQKLHEQYGDRLVVLGFPANNFLWQEPGSNDEIATFCERNYGVTFTMFEKISVKGRGQHPLFSWLEKESGHAPSWNFCKYVISEEGKVLGYFPSKVSPLDPSITGLLQ